MPRRSKITGRAAATRYHCDETSFRLALDEYDAISKSLLASPVSPGWYYRRGKWILRGEFADVPKRFLDLRSRPGVFGTRDEALGNVDDRAHEFEHLGIYNGDDLIAWMQRAKRPRKRSYTIEERVPASTSAERMRAKRLRARAEGLCIVCCQVPAREGKTSCLWCNDKAAQTMARKREAKKIPLPVDTVDDSGLT